MTVLVNMYLANNLGDDLFIKVLLERYPKVNFKFLYSEKEYPILKKYSNASIILIPRLTRFHFAFGRLFSSKLAFKLHLRRIKQLLDKENKSCDAFLTLGGSLFMEGKNEYFKKKFYEIIYSAFKNKPKFIIGSNFGPYKTDSYKLFFKKIFSESTDVCFRDIYSYNLFSDISSVRYSPDVVFELKPTYNRVNMLKTVGFVPILLNNRYELSNFVQEYNMFFAKMIKKFLDNDFDVSIYSFCKSEGDVEAVNTILNLLSIKLKDKVNTLYYNGLNMEDLLFQFSKNSYIVCSRFHSMILGLINKQNVYAITYSDKMKYVLEDINYTGDYINISEINSNTVNETYSKVLDNEFNFHSFYLNEENQFTILDDFLK